MPVLASEAMRGLSSDMLSRAWKHLALDEHELLEDLVEQAQSWHDRGVLFADAPTDKAEDCQDDNFDDEEDNEIDDHEEEKQEASADPTAVALAAPPPTAVGISSYATLPPKNWQVFSSQNPQHLWSSQIPQHHDDLHLRVLVCSTLCPHLRRRRLLCLLHLHFWQQCQRQRLSRL
eukprot:98544-Amphidinium_carterae.2